MMSTFTAEAFEQLYRGACATMMMPPSNPTNTSFFSSIQSQQAINTEPKPKPKKPKRPLSGYNLFYRYKRNKIIEATAQATPASDTKAIINAVITALPGLENVNTQDHPLWTSYPPESIEKLRASNIRASMEGKLFPNENSRSRLHRKSHGMGFLEMGKAMREMWANIDDLTNEVFSELADFGRVRYKKLLVEWKSETENDGTAVDGEMTSPAPVSGNNKKVESRARQPANKRVQTTYPNEQTAAKRFKAMHPNNPNEAAVASMKSATWTEVSAAVFTTAMACLSSSKIEATPKAVEKRRVLSFVSPTSRKAKVQATNPFIVSPVSRQAQASAAPVPVAATIISPVIPSTSSGTSSYNNRNYHRCSNSCDGTLDPFPIWTRSFVQKTSPATTGVDLAAPNRHSSSDDLSEHISIGKANPATVDLVLANRSRRVSDPADFIPVNRRDSNGMMAGNGSRAADMRAMTGDAVSTSPAAVMMGNSSVFNNTQAGSMVKNAAASSTTNKKTYQEIKHEFLTNFRRFLLRDSALIRNSVSQSDNSKPASMNDAVGDRNSIRNSMIIPPPPLFGRTGVVGNNHDMISGSMMFKNQPDSIFCKNEEEVYAQDIVELIGQLDEAADVHSGDHHFLEEKNKDCDCFHRLPSIEKTNSNNSCDNLSFIFGKPVHDVQMNSTTSTVPMPTAYELKNNRARTA